MLVWINQINLKRLYYNNENLALKAHQVSNWQHMVEPVCHRVVLHSHEEGVENNADGYGQVYKWIHHHHVHNLLHL